MRLTSAVGFYLRTDVPSPPDASILHAAFPTVVAVEEAEAAPKWCDKRPSHRPTGCRKFFWRVGRGWEENRRSRNSKEVSEQVRASTTKKLGPGLRQLQRPKDRQHPKQGCGQCSKLAGGTLSGKLVFGKLVAHHANRPVDTPRGRGAEEALARGFCVRKPLFGQSVKPLTSQPIAPGPPTRPSTTDTTRVRRA